MQFFLNFLLVVFTPEIVVFTLNIVDFAPEIVDYTILSNVYFGLKIIDFTLKTVDFKLQIVDAISHEILILPVFSFRVNPILFLGKSARSSRRRKRRRSGYAAAQRQAPPTWALTRARFYPRSTETDEIGPVPGRTSPTAWHWRPFSDGDLAIEAKTVKMLSHKVLRQLWANGGGLTSLPLRNLLRNFPLQLLRHLKAKVILRPLSRTMKAAALLSSTLMTLASKTEAAT